MNRGDTQYHTERMVVENCYLCGLPFGMPESYRQSRFANHSLGFYCPNGHRQFYMGESYKDEAARLKDEKEAQARRAVAAEAEVRRQERLKNKAHERRRRLEKRMANGVCPCCNRTFKQLARHMVKKHPEYKDKKSK